MKDHQIPPLALTFDDVLILPGLSEVHPNGVSLRTRLCRGIEMNIPLVSAAMDTVTEARLAISLAQEGGIGILHKNLSIAAQADEVDKVKRSEAGMIVDPVTIQPDQKIREALDVMARYKISGVPVTDADGHLVGILTNRDLRFETDLEKPIDALMTKENLVTVPEGTTLEEAKSKLHEHRIEKLLVVDGEGNLKGLITVKDIQKQIEFPQRLQGLPRPAARRRRGRRLGRLPGAGRRRWSRRTPTCWCSTPPTPTAGACSTPPRPCASASPRRR